jgi:hypothetical protein
MQGGDIASGWETNRIVLVWEGVCGTRPTGAAAIKDRYYRARGDWDEVVRLWGFQVKPLQRAYALAYKNIPVDVVTFIAPEFREALEDRLGTMDVRIARVEWYEDPETFASVLLMSRDIDHVVDSDRKRLKLYGRRAYFAEHGGDFGAWM